MKLDGLTGEDCSKRSNVSAEQHSSTGLITSYRTSSPRQVMAVWEMRSRRRREERTYHPHELKGLEGEEGVRTGAGRERDQGRSPR